MPCSRPGPHIERPHLWPEVEVAWGRKNLGQTELQTDRVRTADRQDRLLVCVRRGTEGLIKYGESPVVRAILSETEEIGHWVGSMTEPLVANPGNLHELYVGPDRDGRGLLFGQVKLFADSPSPGYGVILGELQRNTS